MKKYIISLLFFISGCGVFAQDTTLIQVTKISQYPQRHQFKDSDLVIGDWDSAGFLKTRTWRGWVLNNYMDSTGSGGFIAWPDTTHIIAIKNDTNLYILTKHGAYVKYTNIGDTIGTTTGGLIGTTRLATAASTIGLIHSASVYNWLLFGNANTNPRKNFVGTDDNEGLTFRTDSIQQIHIDTNHCIISVDTIKKATWKGQSIAAKYLNDSILIAGTGVTLSRGSSGITINSSGTTNYLNDTIGGSGSKPALVTLKYGNTNYSGGGSVLPFTLFPSLGKVGLNNTAPFALLHIKSANSTTDSLSFGLQNSDGNYSFASDNNGHNGINLNANIADHPVIYDCALEVQTKNQFKNPSLNYTVAFKDSAGHRIFDVAGNGIGSVGNVEMFGKTYLTNLTGNLTGGLYISGITSGAFPLSITGIDATSSNFCIVTTDNSSNNIFAVRNDGQVNLANKTTTNIYGSNSVLTTLTGGINVNTANQTGYSTVGANSASLNIISTDAYAINKGGNLSFGGYYSGGVISMAGIGGRLENASTSGSYINFLIHTTGHAIMTEAARFNSCGALQDSGVKPTIAAGAGAGSGLLSPVVSDTGVGMGVNVVVTTGTTTTTGVICTLTFTTAFTNGCVPELTPANSTTASLSGTTMVYVTGSTTQIAINSGSTALTGAGTTYAWHLIWIGF